VALLQPTGTLGLIDGLGSLEAGVYPALRSLNGQIFISGLADCRRNNIARALDYLGGRISITRNGVEKLTTNTSTFAVKSTYSLVF